MMLPEIIRVLNTIAEPSRMRILLALSARRMCVCELCAALGLGQAAASQHLRVLRDCGLVWAEKDGLWVDYAISKTAFTGSAGRILKTILREAGRDASSRKDRKAASKADRAALCCRPGGNL